MLRNYIKVWLFLSSYIPLFIIFMIRNLSNTSVIAFLAAIIIGSGVVIFFMFYNARRISGSYRSIEKVENIGRVGLEYFVTYVIPFLSIDLLKLSDVASILIFFGIMGVIYVKSDLIYMNPMLNLLGFNFYKVISDGNELVVISRKKRNQLKPTEEVIELGDNVVIGKDRWRT